VAKKKEDRIIHKIRDKYRLVIMNDTTFEERGSLRLSLLNLIVVSSVVIIMIIVLVTSLIIYTPLKIYIPGYADVNMRQDLTGLILKTDSLEQVIYQKNVFLDNIKNVMEGNVESEDDVIERENVKVDKVPDEYYVSRSDSLLRAEVEAEESNFDLYYNEDQREATGIANFTFFAPLKGIITEKFNPKDQHYGTDIVAPKDEAVKATLDGTVIMASWTSETGYVIGIQHTHNLVSFYKHNSVLLKEVGNFVKAGEVIAIIGDSGELSSGPHLHFELLINGKNVDPEIFF